MPGAHVASRSWASWLPCLALLAACGARTGLDDLPVILLGGPDGGGSSGTPGGGGSGAGDDGSTALFDGGGTFFTEDADDGNDGGDDGGSGSSCGPATCDGCCAGSTCRSGLDREACGHGGQACRFCDPELTCSQTARQCM